MRAALIAVSALFLAACGGGGGGAPAAAQDPVKVRTAGVTRVEVREPVVATGTIAAAKTTDVGPSVDGIIEAVFVKVGDRVKAGDQLFKTRDVDYRLMADQAAQSVRLAEAQAANAKRAFERADRLKDQGVAAEGRFEDARTAWEVAEAQAAVARSKLAAAEQALADTLVLAPFDGAITRRDVDPGRFMATRMGGMGMGGGASGVVQIMDLSIVGAIVNAPESALKLLRKGAPAKLHIDGVDRVFESEVHVINDRVDWQTRSVEVRIAIRNEDYAVKPGMFVRAEILPDGRPALAVERGAILGLRDSRFAYVARDGKAVRVPVKARDLDATRIEIIEGLAEGDKVLAGPGLSRLFDGAPVIIEEPVAQAGG
jgi:RND family efflux transporter MFP subunit